MKKKIEIDDTLQERVNDACDELKDLLLEYLRDNPDQDETPCLSNDLDYDGRFHEIVDGSVPVYYHEIDTCWYLHGNQIEAAWEDAGMDGSARDNHGMVAIYCYIQQECAEWYEKNAEDIFGEWREATPNPQDEE